MKKNWYFPKATADWNIEMENILEKKRIKVN